MNCSKIAMAGTVAALTLAMGAALAADAVCPNTPAAKRIVENARKQRAQFLEHLFDTQYGCLALEQFGEKAHQLALQAMTTDPCVLKGIREATNATIVKVSERCVGSVTEPERLGEAMHAAGECANNGSQVGRLAATAFCFDPTGGPGTTPSVCQSIATQACKIAFRSYVLDNCSEKEIAYPEMFEESLAAACNPAA